MNKKIKKGFTLIELIVVIAIIGVLMMIATPVLKGYTTKANETKYLASSESVMKAIAMFTAEHPDFYQNFSDYTTQTNYGEWTGLTYIRPEFIEPYIDSNLKVTDDEMQKMDEDGGYVRIEYTGHRSNEDFNFEIQIGGSEHDRPEGKEYGRYYYEPK